MNEANVLKMTSSVAEANLLRIKGLAPVVKMVKMTCLVVLVNVVNMKGSSV